MSLLSIRWLLLSVSYGSPSWSSEQSEVTIGEFHGPFGESDGQVFDWIGIEVACDPCHELHAPHHDERVDFHEIRVGEWQYLTVSVEPCVHQIGNNRFGLDEG